jgi:hypothetical protein
MNDVSKKVKSSWVKSKMKKRDGGPVDPTEIYNGILALKPKTDKELAMKMARQVSQVSYDNNIDPYSLTAQIFQESGFNPAAESPKGAKGVAQLMPATSKKYGVDPNDPIDSLRVMADYMASNRIKNKKDGLPDDEATAQMRYNAGGPNLKKWMKSGNIARETKEYPERIAAHRSKAFGDAKTPDYLYLGGIDENDPRIDQYAITAKKMRAGGVLQQYNAPTHEQGGQMVDAMGNPTNDPSAMAAEIEKKEVSLKDSALSQPYVLSDHMINPATGNTYAKDATRMEKKMKGDDGISRNGRRLAMEILMRSNEASRQKYGGKILRAGGWPIESIANLSAGIGQAIGVPPEEDENQAPQAMSPEFYNKRLEDFRSLIMNPSQQPSDYASSNNFPDTANVPDPFGGNAYERVTAPAANIDSTQQIDDREKVSLTPANSGMQSLLPLLGGGEALKAGAGILSAGMALQPAEKEKLRVPEYGRGDQHFADMGTDMQALKNQIMGMYSAARQGAQESSRSFGQYQNRLRGASTATGRELAGTELQGQMYNDRINAMRGQREDMKAQTVAAEQVRKQNADSANVAMRQDQIQNVLNQADRFGTEMMANKVLDETTKNFNDAQRKQFIIDMAAMEMKHPDFELNEELRSLLADPDATYEQLRDAISKSLIKIRPGFENRTRIGNLETKTEDGTE